MRFPEDWHGGAPLSPRRQLFIVLAGEIEIWTSIGETTIFKLGDRLLGEGMEPVLSTAMFWRL